MQPNLVFLLFTILVSASAIAMLYTAFLTDFWEIVRYNSRLIEEVTAARNRTHLLEWMSMSSKSSGKIEVSSVPRISIRRGGEFWRAANKNTMSASAAASRRTKRELLVAFLVPMRGGIWSLCVDLPVWQVNEIREMGFAQDRCIYYLSSDLVRPLVEGRPDWQQKMRNLSISCTLVSMIVLGAAVVVGAFGIVQHQISAVLVTGVMYVLSAVFAIFTLGLMHLKRRPYRGDCGLLDTLIPPEYYPTRIFATGWSLHLGWGGVATLLLAAVLWISLAKIMRYNPLSLT